MRKVPEEFLSPFLGSPQSSQSFQSVYKVLQLAAISQHYFNLQSSLIVPVTL